MQLKLTNVYKSLITVVALKWFFTSVKPFMYSQVVILYKSHVTVVALEWFFTSVKPEAFHAFSGCPSG